MEGADAHLQGQRQEEVGGFLHASNPLEHEALEWRKGEKEALEGACARARPKVRVATASTSSLRPARTTGSADGMMGANLTRDEEKSRRGLTTDRDKSYGSKATRRGCSYACSGNQQQRTWTMAAAAAVKTTKTNLGERFGLGPPDRLAHVGSRRGLPVPRKIPLEEINQPAQPTQAHSPLLRFVPVPLGREPHQRTTSTSQQNRWAGRTHLSINTLGNFDGK